MSNHLQQIRENQSRQASIALPHKPQPIYSSTAQRMLQPFSSGGAFHPPTISSLPAVQSVVYANGQALFDPHIHTSSPNRSFGYLSPQLLQQSHLRPTVVSTANNGYLQAAPQYEEQLKGNHNNHSLNSSGMLIPPFGYPNDIIHLSEDPAQEIEQCCESQQNREGSTSLMGIHFSNDSQGEGEKQSFRLKEDYMQNELKYAEEEDEEEEEEYDDEEDEDDGEIEQVQGTAGANNIDKQVKSYVCKECSKNFRAKKSLRDHLRIHANERPYECDEPHCGKNFVQYSSLQKHQRTHRGERPYKCDFKECDQAFTQVSNLKRHQKIHQNDKPFQCDQCDRRFTTTSNLKQHQLTHENGARLRFECAIEECKKSYLYSSSLKKHEKEHILNNSSTAFKQHNGVTCPPSQLQQKDQAETQEIARISHETNQETLLQEDFCCSQEGKKKLKNKEEQKHQQQQQPLYSNKVSEEMDMLSAFFSAQHVALQHDGHYDVLFKGYLYHYNKKTGKIEIHDIQAQDEIGKGKCQPLSETSHVEISSPKVGPTMSCCGTQEIKIENSTDVTSSCVTKEHHEISQGMSLVCCDEPNCGKDQVLMNSDFEQQSCDSHPNCNSPSHNQDESSKQKGQDVNSSCLSSGEVKIECICAEQCDSSCVSCVTDPASVCKYRVRIGPSDSGQAQINEMKQPQKPQPHQCQGCSSSWTTNVQENSKHVHGPNCGHVSIYHQGHLDYIVENQLHHPHGTHCDFHGIVNILDNIVKI